MKKRGKHTPANQGSNVTSDPVPIYLSDRYQFTPSRHLAQLQTPILPVHMPPPPPNLHPYPPSDQRPSLSLNRIRLRGTNSLFLAFLLPPSFLNKSSSICFRFFSPLSFQISLIIIFHCTETPVCMCVCVRVCVRPCVRACVRACVCVCVCVCVQTLLSKYICKGICKSLEILQLRHINYNYYDDGQKPKFHILANTFYTKMTAVIFTPATKNQSLTAP